MSNEPSVDRSTANLTATALLLVGLTLLAVGLLVAGTQWPSDPIDCSEYATDCTTGMSGVLSGIGIAVAGVLAALVPAVAWGVRLGREMPA